ncbi:MAG: hypothetical protein ACOVVK_06530 [Elsteraceae bacterium]
MIGFLVVVSVGLFAALAYVLARRARRRETPSASLRLAGPKTADIAKAEPPTRTMVDVTPRGTSIKV